MRDPQMGIPFEEMDWMGEAILGSAAATLTLTFPYGVNIVEGYARVSGYASGSIMGLRLNADSGNNYIDRTMVSTSVTNQTSAAGRASVRCATVGITGPRPFVRFSVLKHRANLVARIWGWTCSDIETIGASPPLMYQFTGIWGNTSALITGVQLEGGGANLNSATWVGCYGAKIIS
jgi:hypothetical protein